MNRSRGRRRRAIYVESRINAPIDRLWEATQDPGQHERWDLASGVSRTSSATRAASEAPTSPEAAGNEPTAQPRGARQAV